MGLSGGTNVWEYEDRARARMESLAWDYYASGADDERCLARNREAFEQIRLHYRVLRDVSERDLSTSVLGQTVSMPLLAAPSAFHRLADQEGEKATARAVRDAGTVMILSTLSNTAVEDVVAEAPGQVWFQLYVYRDRGLTEALIERVEQAGCRALVLTVDAPVLGKRERDARNRFTLPPGLRIENMLPAGMEGLPKGVEDSGLAAYFASLIDPALSWADIAWLRERTKLPIIIKGIVRADDASRAFEHGASGIVVSNHGGRQLDAAPATMEVLPRIAEAVAGAGEIYVDGGVRRGSDVVKALALGARAALLGRPILWGLGAAGEEGVRGVLELLRSELDTAMALCGCPRVSDVTRDLVDPR